MVMVWTTMRLFPKRTCHQTRTNNLRSLSFKDGEMDRGLGIAGRKTQSRAPTDIVSHPSPKDYHSNFLSHHKNDQPYVSFPQNPALLGNKYELACIHWTVGINMFFFLGNMFWGISLQAHSVFSTLDLFSFYSTTQKDEKSKPGEVKRRSHKLWCCLAHSDSPWSCMCTPSASSEDLNLLSLPSRLCDSMTLAVVVCQTQLITVGWFQ